MIRHTRRLLQVKVLASWVAVAMWWPPLGLSLDIRGHLRVSVCVLGGNNMCLCVSFFFFVNMVCVTIVTLECLK